ncbi:MAG: TonB-dependent receptor [Patescibacteria group bacterium]|nr:TonB-dependent receptor [Patescibacteria group bacterium]MEA3501099.1 TonB-dependent receptor [Candidatus Neomarinimicrobiota bacterium]
MYYIKKILLVLLFSIQIYAVNYSAVIKGKIVDEKGKPLAGANILLKNKSVGTVSDKDGYYYIKSREGKDTLEITFIGYKKITEIVRLNNKFPMVKNYKMVLEYFQIGGITVVAEKELLQSYSESKTIINSGEIEHMQASSLSDVMQLVPGQKFENSGLQSKKQASIRTKASDNAAEKNVSFGTQIILDGVPVSNNANMQIDTRTTTSSGELLTTENSGIDLRQIPADNIEEVEVIRGVPSSKYGDLTSGIVKVKTKSERKYHRMKYKYNFKNQEINFGGGFKFFKQHLNYNFNYAHSVRDIRVPDKNYSRVAGQLTFTNHLFKNKIRMSNKAYYTRSFDEHGLREGDLMLTEKYNRDYILRLIHNSKYIITKNQKLDFTYSFFSNNQNSFVKRLVTVDNTYITDMMTNGTKEGEYIQHYLSELNVKGRACNSYTNVEYTNFMEHFLDHKISFGMTLKNEFNDGDGRIYDANRPPRINDNKRERPRKYDDIPALTTSSLYFENRIQDKNKKYYQLNLGLRYDSYGQDNFFTNNHGKFFSPRINLSLFLGENAQLRIGYGETSKSPSLSMLYPNKLYFDVDDINEYNDVDSLRKVIVSTYVYDKRNSDLKASKQIKREISLDQKINNVGLSITGYYNNTYNGFASSKIIPIFQYKYDYPNWPDTSNKFIKDSVFTTFSIYENSLSTISKGLEMSIQTKKLKFFDMKLRVEAAYNNTYSYRKNTYEYASIFRVDNTYGDNIKPFWNPINMVSEDLIVNYNVDFMLKELGAWVTIIAQQVVFEKDWYVNLDDSLAIGYINDHGETTIFSPSERNGNIGSIFKRVKPSYVYEVENRKNIWIFNLRVSKSIFKGSEVSFYVNNIFNSHPLYRRKRTPTESYTKENPDLYFGIEFSTKINELFK